MRWLVEKIGENVDRRSGDQKRVHKYVGFSSKRWVRKSAKRWESIDERPTILAPEEPAVIVFDRVKVDPSFKGGRGHGGRANIEREPEHITGKRLWFHRDRKAQTATIFILCLAKGRIEVWKSFFGILKR